MAIKVLIVEDDREQANLLEQTLSSIGWIAMKATSGEDGLIQTLKHKPQLIVVDIQLPDFNGFEFCRRIKSDSQIKATPVLMITGTYQRDEDKLRAQALGADAYMLKPFHLTEFLATVRRLVPKSLE